MGYDTTALYHHPQPQVTAYTHSGLALASRDGLMCRLKFPVESSPVSIRNIRPASLSFLSTKKKKSSWPPKNTTRQISLSPPSSGLTAWSLASFSGPVHAPKPQSPRQVSTPHFSHPSSHLSTSITHSAASSPQSQGHLPPPSRP